MASVTDARGRSCPEPVIMTKAALAQRPDCCEVLVDNQTALGNVTRFAKNQGYAATFREEGEFFRVSLRRA
ncbi:MAG: sulfurtransferase TusA family protein [Oscillospiraceae bacterium]|nr:sulfurtransferase TusA family protein [Oscillospiraceae bacterium]